MADRSHTTDREAGRIADQIGVGSAHVRRTEDVPDLGGVDLVVSAREHQDRRPVRGEHQRLDDRADGDVERVGRVDRSPGRLTELTDLGVDPAGAEGSHDPFDARMHDRHVSAVGKVRAMTEGVEPGENRLIRLLAIVLLAGAGVRLLAAIVAGFVEWHHASFVEDPSGRFRATDVLTTFGAAGDTAGIALAVLALLVVWQISRTEEPLAPALQLATCWILGVTAVLAVMEAIGVGLLFTADPDHIETARIVQSSGAALAALVIAGGGMVLTRQYGLMLDEHAAADDVDAFVFAADRHSIDVRAFFAARDAVRRMHLYTVEEEEFDFYTDEGEVLTASVVDGRIALQPTGQLRLDELLARLKEFTLRRGITVDDEDADDPTAYVDPINKWQWLEMWPPWMRPLGYLFRRR